MISSELPEILRMSDRPLLCAKDERAVNSGLKRHPREDHASGNYGELGGGMYVETNSEHAGLIKSTNY